MTFGYKKPFSEKLRSHIGELIRIKKDYYGIRSKSIDFNIIGKIGFIQSFYEVQGLIGVGRAKVEFFCEGEMHTIFLWEDEIEFLQVSQ